MRRVLSLVAILSLAGVGAAACGDDGGSDDQAFVDAIAASMIEENDPSSGLTEENADCAAKGVVDTLGTGGLVDLGLTVQAIEDGKTLDDSKLERADAEKLADKVVPCFDFGEIIGDQFPGELSEKSKECLGDKLKDTQYFRDAMIAGMLGGTAADLDTLDQSTQTEFAEILTGCLTSEELVQLGRASSGSPSTPTTGG